MNFHPCLLAPVYNHGRSLVMIADQLRAIALPCILVNDGSNAATRDELQRIGQSHAGIEVLHHDRNRGKGAACITGLRHARSRGYTHVVQVDADGQHDLADLPAFVDAAREHPTRFIMGEPVFDASIPKHRYYGRYLTHVLVWIECLSTALKDTMCGYRVYPLESVTKILDRHRVGQRMDFDPEIAVRLYWEGVQPMAIPTKVVYRPDAVSHFRMFRDNVLISWMHTRLLLGMVPRIPRLLKRR